MIEFTRVMAASLVSAALFWVLPAGIFMLLGITSPLFYLELYLVFFVPVSIIFLLFWNDDKKKVKELSS